MDLNQLGVVICISRGPKGRSSIGPAAVNGADKENRDQAREERQPAKKPKPAVFRFVPPAKEFKLTLQFRKNSIQREEVIQALKHIIESLESEV